MYTWSSEACADSAFSRLLMANPVSPATPDIRRRSAIEPRAGAMLPMFLAQLRAAPKNRYRNVFLTMTSAIDWLGRRSFTTMPMRAMPSFQFRRLVGHGPGDPVQASGCGVKAPDDLDVVCGYQHS